MFFDAICQLHPNNYQPFSSLQYTVKVIRKSLSFCMHTRAPAKRKHPKCSKKNFRGGVPVTDGYSVYKHMDRINPDITFGCCWAHARRRYAGAQKALFGDGKKRHPKPLPTRHCSASHPSSGKIMNWLIFLMMSD